MQEKSICDHLQTLLTSLGNAGKLTLSTSGPPQPDQSLFNNPEFWKVASVQHASGKQNCHIYDINESSNINSININVTKKAFLSTDHSNFDSEFLQYLDSMAVQGLFFSDSAF